MKTRMKGQALTEFALILPILLLLLLGIIEGARITDVAPTILHLLGLPVPEGFDGKVLTEALEPEVLKANPIRHEDIPLNAEVAGFAMTETEEEEIRKKKLNFGKTVGICNRVDDPEVIEIIKKVAKTQYDLEIVGFIPTAGVAFNIMPEVGERLLRIWNSCRSPTLSASMIEHPTVHTR
jgi:hypothetical protein